MPSDYLILCHSLLLLPSIFLSMRVFSKESVFRIRWPKFWSFSFSISPSNEYSGLISFRMDWLDLLAVQGTLKSLFQSVQKQLIRQWHLPFWILCTTQMTLCWKGNMQTVHLSAQCKYLKTNTDHKNILRKTKLLFQFIFCLHFELIVKALVTHFFSSD